MAPNFCGKFRREASFLRENRNCYLLCVRALDDDVALCFGLFGVLVCGPAQLMLMSCVLNLFVEIRIS